MKPNDFSSAVAFAFEATGGIGAAAKACGRSYQALNKWRLAASLPRTDYTGETRYAALLSEAARKNNVYFDASWLLEASYPHKAAA
jgi:hypothetical protein